MRRNCTCAGPAPGWPQHEPFCGQPEDDDTYSYRSDREHHSELLAAADQEEVTR